MLWNSNDSIMSWKVDHVVIRSYVEDVVVSAMVSIWDVYVVCPSRFEEVPRCIYCKTFLIDCFVAVGVGFTIFMRRYRPQRKKVPDGVIV